MLTILQYRNSRHLCSLIALLLVIAVPCPGWSAIDETVEQLRLDYAAFRAAEDDYRQQRQFNGLEGTDAADYATYVARLQRRVFEDCQAVIRAGSSMPENVPCPEQGQATTKSADIATQTEQTSQEQIAALDRMLNAGLGEYDEKLLREQERIKAATPNDNSDTGGDGGAAGQGDGSDGDGSEGDGSAGDGSEGGSEGEDQETGGSPGGSREGDQAGGQRRGGTRDSSTGSGDDGSDQDQPSDIPDGSDDDVVARQLREAAEKETDPELKAKLWEEYRRYKRGTN